MTCYGISLVGYELLWLELGFADEAVANKTQPSIASAPQEDL
jgi:hypothetical protein